MRGHLTICSKLHGKEERAENAGRCPTRWRAVTVHPLMLSPQMGVVGSERMSEDASGAFRETYADLYDRLLVPLLFAPYAQIISRHVLRSHPRAILETAAGTGVLSHELARDLPPDVSITATDLNQPMLDKAQAKPGSANITWRQADAMKLPFPNESFDLAVCQFGVMFFPDKAASFQEIARVLRRGGSFVFVVWDDWAQMEHAPLAMAADVVSEILGCEPRSLVNPPYHDEATIRADLATARFEKIDIQRVTQPARAASAHAAAVATVHGSLIRTVIESKAPERLQEATNAWNRRFVPGMVMGKSLAPPRDSSSLRESPPPDPARRFRLAAPRPRPGRPSGPHASTISRIAEQYAAA
jgi:ubiquinone/menaquinone biosynthesis C-methylase UbiE